MCWTSCRVLHTGSNSLKNSLCYVWPCLFCFPPQRGSLQIEEDSSDGNGTSEAPREGSGVRGWDFMRKDWWMPTLWLTYITIKSGIWRSSSRTTRGKTEKGDGHVFWMLYFRNMSLPLLYLINCKPFKPYSYCYLLFILRWPNILHNALSYHHHFFIFFFSFFFTRSFCTHSLNEHKIIKERFFYGSHAFVRPFGVR